MCEICEACGDCGNCASDCCASGQSCCDGAAATSCLADCISLLNNFWCCCYGTNSTGGCDFECAEERKACIGISCCVALTATGLGSGTYLAVSAKYKLAAEVAAPQLCVGGYCGAQGWMSLNIARQRENRAKYLQHGIPLQQTQHSSVPPTYNTML